MVSESVNQLISYIHRSKQQSDIKTLTDYLKLIVDFSRGFHAQAKRPEVKEKFEQVLGEVMELTKIKGIEHMTSLQEQMIKYIDRQIQILGSKTSNLVVSVVVMQLQMIQSVEDGQVEKIEPLLSLLNNYVGYLKENSLEAIDLVFPSLFDKIRMIPVPLENTSEI
jgi:hypothetical protein